MAVYFKTIRSSSSGNCLALRTEKSDVLIDCGFSSRISFRKAAAIGFAFLALLGLPKSVNAYNGFDRSYYNRGVRVGWGYGGLPGGWVYDRPIYEQEGKMIIYRYFRSKNIKFKMDRPIKVGGTRIFYLMPDFMLKNDVIIEYWSPEDAQYSEYIKREYQRYKEIVRGEINIISEQIKRNWTLTEKQREGIISMYLDRRGIKYEGNPISKINYTIIRPDFLVGKKEIYEKYKETGGKVYLIGPKDTEDAVSIEQELDKILEEMTRERILTEKQAEEIISKYLKNKNIRFEIDRPFRSRNGRWIRPDFLLENGTAIEYWSKEDRRHRHNERIYEECGQTEERFYLIKSGDRKEMLDKLDKIVNDISD